MSSERPWLESLASCIPDPLIFVQHDWTIVWSNREFSILVGSKKSLKGAGLGEFIAEWESISAQLLLALETNSRASANVWLQDKDKNRIPAQLYIARCQQGIEPKWVIHLRNQQDVHDLRQKLSDRERSHSFLQSNTSDLIVRLDDKLHVTWCNENAGNFFREGESLSAYLRPESMALFGGAADLPQRFEVCLQSAIERRNGFQLTGIARRLFDETGHGIGFSLLLHDDSDKFRIAKFAAQYQLSSREEEVIQYLFQGYSNLNIASILGLSESGVKFHIRNVFSRAKVGSRTELVALLLNDH